MKTIQTKEIIAFTPARTERYARSLIKGLREQAEQAGYAITIYENNFDQQEQNEQIKRQLESGASPSLWMIWPVEQTSALSSIGELYQTNIPTIQLNQLPDAKTKPYILAFAGPDDTLRARNAARMLIEARDKAHQAGKQLHGDSGHMIALTYPNFYSGYGLSMDAFISELEGSGIKLIGETNPLFDRADRYKKTVDLLAKVKSQGVDFVYAMDDAILTAAAPALEEAGFTLGQDLILVGTVGNGNRRLLDEGKQYGTTLQAPLFEGQLAIKIAEEYFKTGQVKEFANFTPNPPVKYDEITGFQLEGFDGVTYPMDELCAWESDSRQIIEQDIPLLRLTSVKRSFGAIQALKEANFELHRGEVMALVGENGAGKSTLVKIISGFDSGFTGIVEMDGKPIELGSPSRAEEMGIAIAQQELSLIPTMTVAENIFLADTRQKNWASIGMLAKEARKYLDMVGLNDVDPRSRVDRLSVGQQQLVEVSRLIARDAQILILDEPTAALGERESRRILDMVTSLAQQGKAIIYVSHRLDEIFEISHRVTVLRDGRSQEAVQIDRLTMNTLIERMIGRSLKNMFPPRSQYDTEPNVVLEIIDLWPDGLVKPVSLNIHAGEILGLAGQLGSGSGYLLAAIAGSRQTRGGRLQLDGKVFSPEKPADAIRNKIAYCSSDRKHDGLYLERPIYENLSSPALERITTLGGWLLHGKERQLALELGKDMTIDTKRIDDNAQVLSGGNQQKVAVGKWLSIKPKVLLIDEPTRGVDVGARAEIYQRLRDLANSGVAVVFASTDIQEITYLPDRTVTFYRGEMISSFKTRDDDSTRILKEITQPDDLPESNEKERTA